MFLFILLARLLGPSEFGSYLFFLTLLQLITVVSDLGLIQWFQKEAHNRATSELIHAVLPVRATTLIVSLIVTYIATSLTHLLSVEAATLLLILMIPEAFLSVLDGYYFHLNKSFLVALKTAIESALMIIGVLLFKSGIHFHTVAYIYLVTTIVSLTWYVPWKRLKGLTFPTLAKQANILRSSMKYAYLIFTSFAYARGDSFVVKTMISNTALGMYGAAYRFLESLSLLPTALSHNLFPVSSKEGAVTAKHLKKITVIMTVVGVAVGLVLWLGADLFIGVFVGPEYAAAIPVLKILSFVLVLFFISAPLSTVVQSSQYIQQFLPWGVANTATNIGLNILLVPILGISGAAYSMLITEITGLIINLWFIRKIYA
ncbi:oligosaccharide flippase family protein [Candidatus Microgenomates bacterium]|nr:oligosaccharide flippase family protein [Candidatus Microgenomates bacterium]